MVASEVYLKTLLATGNGCPLFTPEPNGFLPEEYKDRGILEGDVGILNLDGSWDFLFNVCEGSDHPINVDRIPADFECVRLRESHDISTTPGFHRPRSLVSSTTMETTTVTAEASTAANQVVPGIGIRLVYTSSASKGAMVGLPNGGDRRDLRNKEKIYKLAMRCGASWYKYANEERGRMAPNGSLYVITGCDKANAWGLASWSVGSRGDDISLTFTTKLNDGGASFSYSLETCTPATVQSRVGPSTPSEKANQCIFMRGFKVAVKEPLRRGKPVSLAPIIGARSSKIIPRSTGGSIPYADGRRWPSCSGSLTGVSNGSSSNAQTDDSLEESDEMSDGDVSVVEIPTSEPYHPSNVVIEWLLHQAATDAQVVLVDDEVWMSVLKQDDSEIPDDAELLRRISVMYKPRMESGGALLATSTGNDCIRRDVTIDQLDRLDIGAPSPRINMQNSSIPKALVDFEDSERIHIVGEHPSDCRATRLVGDCTRFLFLDFSGPQDEWAKDRIRRCLNDIIKYGRTIAFNNRNDKYTFFGYTESSMKSGQVILFREDSVWTVDSVKKHLGDLFPVFTKSGAGKYAARLGLAFSSTIESIDIPHDQGLCIGDLEAKDGSLTTDGIGILRESVAKVIREKLAFPPDTSVFQIRRGGMKGLLVAHPDKIFEETCSNSQGEPQSRYMFAYRPSMLKFQGGPTMLEIRGVSPSPPPARLNRFFILQLLSRQVPFAGFEDLLKTQIRAIEMISEDRQKALKYIQGELDAQGESFNQDLFEMLQAGHDMSEPYISSKLRRFQNGQYERLKEKLNIKVDNSCYVYGVVDEQGILNDGTVYINLPDRGGAQVRKVLVTRNPSYLPEDIQVFEAVHEPKLSYLVNCLVFPRTCEHSIPDTMAGGDLDGDIYFVCWDQRIIPSDTCSPQYRTPAPPSTRPHAESAFHNELVETFVEQRKNGILGLASHKWQSNAEATPDLAKTPSCRTVAKIIEELLDVTKTGADYQNLKERFQAVSYPNESGFQSPIKELRKLVPDSGPLNKPDEYPCDPDLNLKKICEKTWMDEYNKARELMIQFNRGLKNAIDDDKKSGNQRASALTQQYIEKYFPPSENFFDYHCYIRASAWYHWGYTNCKPAFAWLGARYLNTIKAWSTNGGRPPLPIGALKRELPHLPTTSSDY